jgi:hypothetical protein
MGSGHSDLQRLCSTFFQPSANRSGQAIQQGVSLATQQVQHLNTDSASRLVPRRQPIQFRVDI